MNYCPDCGKQLEAEHTFCPHCGKDNLGGYKYCPMCGKKIPSKTYYCSECVQQPAQPVIEKPPQAKKKITKKFHLPKFDFKLSRKTAMIVILIICVIAVVGASVVVLQSTDLLGAAGGGSSDRVITVSIQNLYTLSGTCEVSVGGLKQPGSYLILPSETLDIQIKEKDLFMQSDSYSITLFVTIQELTKEETVEDVTELASFRISSDEDVFTIESLA